MEDIVLGHDISIELLDPGLVSDTRIAEAVDFLLEYNEAPRDVVADGIRDCDELILYCDSETKEIGGTTRLYIVDFEIDDEPIRVLITRSVALAEPFRGQNLIQRAGFRSYLRHGLTSRRLTYWFSMMGAYRAYVMAARYMPGVWPRRNTKTPAREKKIYHWLLDNHFSHIWEPDTGLCRPDRVCVDKSELVIPDDAPIDDPDLQFFRERNPDHEKGMMLPVLVRLRPTAFATMAIRLLRKMLR